MEIAALASGSSGNCFYVGNANEAILVDAGISAKQVIKRLLEIGGNPERIKGIFITHEHIDHVRGADVLARKLGVPIYTTKGTASNCFLCSDKKMINTINNDSVVEIGKLKIEAFSKLHSAGEPVSYTIYGDRKKVGVITDVGIVCDNIRKHVKDCDFLFLEANHDEEMLENGPYPKFLKNWIKGEGGHLSNREAAFCVKEYAGTRLAKVVLSHLSKVNNTPSLALETFKGINSNIDVLVSHREVPTEMFRL